MERVSFSGTGGSAAGNGNENRRGIIPKSQNDKLGKTRS